MRCACGSVARLAEDVLNVDWGARSAMFVDHPVANSCGVCGQLGCCGEDTISDFDTVANDVREVHQGAWRRLGPWADVSDKVCWCDGDVGCAESVEQTLGDSSLQLCGLLLWDRSGACLEDA